MNSLCCLCGSDNVQFLLVEPTPEWLAPEEIRQRAAQYRVESYCEQCVAQPRSVGGRIVSIDLHV